MPRAIRFFTDEHVPQAVVRGLRARGVDVVTTQEAGLLSADDETLLEFARDGGRVVVTQDADFLRCWWSWCVRCPRFLAHQNA